MATLNKVLIMGRLTKDPDLRYTPSGTAVCDMSVAINRTWKDTASGEKKDDTVFLDVVVWQKQAENCAEYLRKGREVFIEGRLQQDRWETKDGQKRSKILVVAQLVQFLGGARGEGDGRGEAPGAPPEAGPGPEDAGGGGPPAGGGDYPF